MSQRSDQVQGVTPENGTLPSVSAQQGSRPLESGPQGSGDADNVHEEGITEELEPAPPRTKETWYSIAFQVFWPLLIAGSCMVATGLLLNNVSMWPVFSKVPAFLILTTPLLGLKGNLEMNMAARLSTHANLGQLDTFCNQWRMCTGDLTLTQVQAIISSFVATVVTIVLQYTNGCSLDVDEAFLLFASSMLTSSVLSILLGILMAVLIIVARKNGMNPDNIATPIAASLGDILCLVILAYLSNALYDVFRSSPWICPVIFTAYIASTPLWAWLTYRNIHTRPELLSAWTPVFAALLLDIVAGKILSLGANKYNGYPLYLPIINGVAGNMVSIQCSRLATACHRDTELGVPLPIDGKEGEKRKVCITPIEVFLKAGIHSVSALVLMGYVPSHIFFAIAIHFLSKTTASSDIPTGSQFHPVFFAIYLSCAFVQIAVLLYLTQIIVRYMWYHKLDPDTFSIPYTTALGDLSGSVLLLFCFWLMAETNTLRDQPTRPSNQSTNAAC